MTDAIQGKNQLLYPIDDPDKAWNNALTDSGYNIYRANPFVQSLQRAGRGQRVTYLEDQTLSGGLPGNISDTAGNYGNYLKQQIGSGNAFYNLDRGYAQLQPAIQKIRQYQDDTAAGRTSAAEANPYLGLLSSDLSSNGGQGTANALSYLRSPSMGAQLGRSYSSMLGDIVDSSGRALANDPAASAPNSGKDIWSYIFGGSRGMF